MGVKGDRRMGEEGRWGEKEEIREEGREMGE